MTVPSNRTCSHVVLFLIATSPFWLSADCRADEDAQAPHLVVQNGSTSMVFAVLSADGRFVLTSSVNTTARLWDASTGLLIREFPDAGAIAAVSADAKLAFFNAPSDCFEVNSGTGRQRDSGLRLAITR